MDLASLCGKRVAVTGGGGFIGIPLLHALSRAGADIVTILGRDRPADRIKSLPFSVQLVRIDELAHMGDAIRELLPDFVVHLSAFVSTERSYASLAQTLEWNLLCSIDVLTACAQTGVSRVVLMGSTEEYGQNASPFQTSTAPDPPSPYAASKAAQTAYARMFHSSFQLPTVILRPSVVYGPGQSPRMLIPMVMEALAAGRVIDVTEGQQTRDFVYVEDVVDTILLSLTNPKLDGDVWNVGSGEIVTVRHCVELIEEVTGIHGLVMHGARPYSTREIFQYELELDRTFEALQWRPTVMLEEGLRRTWASVRQAMLGSAGSNLSV